ncbi:MAG: hypothetical protein AAB324_01505 [candidate division NC10 bacterium]
MSDLVVVDDLSVDGDGEDAAVALFEAGGDAELLLDGGLQTGGLGEVVSLSAVGDQNVHPFLLELMNAVYAIITAWPGAVKS